MVFIKKLDMDKIIKKADKMVRQYLPKNANLSNVQFVKKIWNIQRTFILKLVIILALVGIQDQLQNT